MTARPVYFGRKSAHLMARPPRARRGPVTCVCGRALPPESRAVRCDPCDFERTQTAARKVRVRQQRPVIVRHIAGYVPPTGSIARALLGRVIHPTDGR